MLPTIPSAIQDEITKQIGPLRSFVTVSGGCINHGGKVETVDGSFYFLKWNDLKKFPGMFEAEARGLKLLKNANAMSVPNCIAYGATSQHQFLVLEFIESNRKAQKYWTSLGEQLALQHRHVQDQHGLDHDNFIGSLPQRNHQHTSWCRFFVEERLVPQVKMAIDAGYFDNKLAAKFEDLFHRISDLMPEEKPSLLHGDLWSGNVIVNELGLPCVIDPAVYYGSREIEIAFTYLFEGFASEFYDSYDAHFPLERGFHQRVDVYNLYPLLVHVNLFGHSYVSQVVSILNRYS